VLEQPPQPAAQKGASTKHPVTEAAGSHASPASTTPLPHDPGVLVVVTEVVVTVVLGLVVGTGAVDVVTIDVVVGAAVVVGTKVVVGTDVVGTAVVVDGARVVLVVGAAQASPSRQHARQAALLVPQVASAPLRATLASRLQRALAPVQSACAVASEVRASPAQSRLASVHVW
jgi:hypothetical protein